MPTLLFYYNYIVVYIKGIIRLHNSVTIHITLKRVPRYYIIYNTGPLSNKYIIGTYLIKMIYRYIRVIYIIDNVL